ncbi:LOW QUALITY PROTEIN: maestro heat-like repeat-containing protein family member 1 [Podarcis muralis]
MAFGFSKTQGDRSETARPHLHTPGPLSQARMKPFLQTFWCLKKKDQESNENIQESNQGQRDKLEAPSSSLQQSATHDPAGQRTSQLLPMLVKASQSPAEARRKSLAPPVVVFPELVQRQTSTVQPVSSRQDSRQQRHLFLGGKKSPEDSGPVFPELSDEKFGYLWAGKKLLRGRSLRETLEMMDEREILDTILQHLQPAPQTSSVHRKSTILSQDSAASNLRAAVPGQQKTSKSGHEKTVLYRYYGLKLRDSRNKDTVHQYLHLLLKLPLEEETVRENTGERNASITIMFCYGQMALGARPEDLLRFIELIVAELVFQFQNTRKDEALKRGLMKAAILTTKALVQTNVGHVIFPHKAELTICIIEVIEEEPLGSCSISVLHHAIVTVSCMTAVRPPMDSTLRSELVKKSIKKVFSLPSLKLTKLIAGSLTQSSQSQDFYQQTVNACLNMLTSLLSEAPSLEALQDILVHTNGWIDSTEIFGRKRAVKSTSFLMKYVSEHFDFDVSDQGLMLQFQMCFKQVHHTFSSWSSFTFFQLPMVVKEIYNHLHRIPDTRTKEETLSAIVSLATKRLQPVIDSLLDCSMECDESATAIWKALVTDPYSSVKLLRPLLKRLQDEDPKAEVTSRRRSTSQMPMAATNALCHILSFPEATGILKSKFHHLLFALSTQICFVHEARRRGSRATSLIPEPSLHLDPLTSLHLDPLT